MSVSSAFSQSRVKDLKGFNGFSNVGGYTPEVAQPIGLKYKFIRELQYPWIGANKLKTSPCKNFKTMAHNQTIQTTPLSESYGLPTGNMRGQKPGLLTDQNHPITGPTFKKLNNYGFFGV